MKWLNGLQIVIEPVSEVCRAIYVSGLYEPATMAVLQRLLTPGAVFVDAGAHIGAFTLFASTLVGPFGKVISFEPSPREYSSLERNVALNRLPNVTLIQEALYNGTGERTLLVAEPSNSGHNTLGSKLPYAGVEVAERATIRTTTLDDVLRKQRVTRLDAIKLDVEGSECPALEGARDILCSLHPALIVELNRSALHSNGSSAEELERLLLAFNYRLWRIEDATPALSPIASLDGMDEVNIVAMP
jgi:FkbM family methyltransferase